ncbi:hypothetical protein LPW36_01870 [Jinshanibacter sp. LJY008]|uniref:Lipopolysaccharide biosynthesis protein n=1 Tax=Limnobaculum eriocheiris TaxID=2897391 RepID=A0A9X1SJF1_9GAMM|nr:hypothetical protein [Limnobaculum eriocheiris]MCD1124791.1 hypothetical protein [Limnobaculum eriocheiris]
MRNLLGKRIVLFSPKFFGYEYKIRDELKKKGAEVLLFDERPFSSSFGKILLRLNVSVLISYFIHRYYLKKINSFFSFYPDYILFINPESVTPEIMSYIKNIFPETKVIVYMWDSINNKKNSYQYINVVDRFFTFDNQDSLIYPKIIFQPLFFTEEYSEMRKNKKNELKFCFIGTLHSGRFNLVKHISSFFKNDHYGFSFFYCPSEILFLFKRVFTKEMSGVSLRDVSFEPINDELLLDMISKSEFVIDISHPSQSGLTMRTIEMLGAEKKLITTNTNVSSYDFYDKQNICIVDPNNIFIDEDFIRLPYKPIDEEIYLKYSLSSWINNIFSA